MHEFSNRYIPLLFAVPTGNMQHNISINYSNNNLIRL